MCHADPLSYLRVIKEGCVRVVLYERRKNRFDSLVPSSEYARSICARSFYSVMHVRYGKRQENQTMSNMR